MGFTYEIAAAKTKQHQAVSGAYAKAVLHAINRTNSDTGVKENVLTVHVYASKAARDVEAQTIADFQYIVPAATIKDTATSYTYLKTLPDFDGAVDLV